jgi:ORF6N domain-containing protein
MSNTSITLPDESIEGTILLVRGKRVILDHDLARLYGVTTKVLNQAVKRNLDRFPEDFMFQLMKAETEEWQVLRPLRSQIVTLKKGRGTHRKYQPYAFTEHGILMLSSVLKSPRAVQVNIQIMRTFVRLREMLASNEKLIERLDALEDRYDAKFKIVFRAIRQLMNPSAGVRKPIGFRAKENREP